MFQQVEKLKSVDTVRSLIPVSKDLCEFRKTAVAEISNILTGADRRKLLIVGPCSADDERAVCDYAKRLSRVADDVRERLYIVMRVYTAKPRTRGEGYMGIVHSSIGDDGRPSMNKGISAMRRMHVAVVEQSGLPTADEMLYPELIDYISDIVAYAAIGARTCNDPVHRFVASGLDIAVGIKNPLNGDLNDLVGSVHAARLGNDFIYNGYHVRTNGNKLAHAVLRGYVDANGNHECNCDERTVLRLMRAFGSDPIGANSVIIDVGHSNSQKRVDIQPVVMKNLLDTLSANNELNGFVKGFMLESYIESGCLASGGVYGKSRTDPCLGFEQTKSLIYDVADRVAM